MYLTDPFIDCPVCGRQPEYYPVYRHASQGYPSWWNLEHFCDGIRTTSLGAGSRLALANLWNKKVQ